MSRLPSVCPSQHFEVTKKIFKKKWRRNKNLSILEHWSKKFRLFNENISTGLSKLHPTSHLKHSEEELFLEKVICLIILSGSLRKNSRNCGKIFSARLWPLLCKYPRKQFKEGQFYREKKAFLSFSDIGLFFRFPSKTLSRLLKLLLTCPWEKVEKGKN